MKGNAVKLPLLAFAIAASLAAAPALARKPCDELKAEIEPG